MPKTNAMLIKQKANEKKRKINVQVWPGVI